jgi:threonine synthase
MPRIVAIQAAACAPLSAAFECGAAEPVQVAGQPTAAEGIAIAQPVRGAQILAAVRSSGGLFLTVEEGEISASLRDCCRGGWFIEPTAAVAIAGARRFAATIPSGQTIVTAFTGHGLKAPTVVADMASCAAERVDQCGLPHAL